jgi:hypothetical protein
MEANLEEEDKMEDDLKNMKEDHKENEKTKKWKKTNLFSMPLKFRGKPFLGLAQLSQIF